MSVIFDNNQCGDFNHPLADRVQQLGAPESDHRPLVDMANPTEARLAGGMSRASERNGELSLPRAGQLCFDDPYASTVGDGSAASFLSSELQIEQQILNIEKEFSNIILLLEKYIVSDSGGNASTTPPMDSQPANTADSGGTPNQNNPSSDIPPSDTSSNNGGTTLPTDTSSSGGATTPPAGSENGTSITSSNSSSDSSTPPVVTNPNANGDTSAGSNDGDGSGFLVNNGRLTYNGKALAGVNVTTDYFLKVGPQALANQLTSDFPGINVVRLEASPDGGPYTQGKQREGASTADIQADIEALNAKGIGVMIDNHNSDAGGANNVSECGNEAQWFATLAKQNLGNNNVMFQPENEPTGSNQDIVKEQVAAYNAIRAIGSNNVVAFDLEAGYKAAPQLSDPSAYDSMSNYVIDAHRYVSDSQPITDMKNEAAQTASMREANGQAVPVFFGETGNSVDGKQISSAADQLLQTEFTDGNGAIAFTFDHDEFNSPGTSLADNMTDPNGKLNAYGQFIASLIKQSSS